MDDKIAWYENTDGQVTFGPLQVVTNQADGATSVFAANLKGDGDIDVVSASISDDTVTWCENVDGNGTFGVKEDLTTEAYGASAVFVVDVDDDGDQDVLAASFDDAKIAWYENMGPIGSAQFRNAGTNPASYDAVTMPVIGTTFTATVDLLGTTGHSLALLVGFSTPLTLPLSGGQTLLVNIADPDGELLGQPVMTGPVATFDMPIPYDLGLLGAEACTQALQVGGVQPYALSNALDLFLGN